MKRVFRHWWQACLAGLLVGIPTGIGLEFARRAHNDAVIIRVAQEFESQGMSPPLMIDFLQPWVVPILTAIVCTLLAFVIYFVVLRLSRVSISRNDTQQNHWT